MFLVFSDQLESFTAWLDRIGWQKLQKLALVVLTSTGVKGESVRLMEGGFDGYLTKPTPGAILAQTLAAAILRAEGGLGTPLVTRHSLREAEQQRVPQGGPTLRARILLVEDQEVNQVIARKFLEGAGATVEVADNGRIGLEIWAARPFDLILMDCQMPELDGFQATERIRALEKGTGRHIPIIAMTAHAMAEDRERCLAAGMDDYLSKPMGREALLRGVAGWLPLEAGEAAPAETGADLDPDLDQGPALALELPLELDEKLFQELKGVFQGNVQEMALVLFEPFIKKGEELFRSLHLALAAQDFQALRSAAHTLKGSSRTLALNALGRLADRLEHGAGTVPAETLGEWTREAEQAFAQACRFLRGVSG